MVSVLKKREDFLAVSKRGGSIATKGLVLQYLKSAREDKPRLGFTVSGKVGNAVVRNRLRRRLKAIARELESRMEKPGYDYVIIGRAAGIERGHDDLTKDLKYALHQVNNQEVK